MKKQLPLKIKKALKDANIQINTNYNFQVYELASNLKNPKIFYSYTLGSYRTRLFYYVITVPQIKGELVVEDTGLQVRVIKNTLTSNSEPLAT